MRIAVLGGGHGAYAAAAEMSELGHEVRFWRRDATAFAPVLETGIIAVTDHRGVRPVRIARPTLSLADAIDRAELVLIMLPATAHETLAPAVAKLLTDGQVVFLPPGTLGTIVLARAAAACGNRADIAYAETGTLPYLVRKQGPAAIRISVYAKRLPTGVFPARVGASALARLRHAYPAVEPVADVLSAALMNAGPIIHPPLILMNAGPLEHFDAWDIHNEGTQPAIRRVTDALDRERIALREALGYGAPHFPLADHYAADGDIWMYGRGAHDRLTDSGDWRERIDLVHHRYMQEDTALGLSLMASVAHWIGQPAPIAEGMLAMASAIAGDAIDVTGRTLPALGLAGFSRDRMAEFLTDGV